MLIEELNSHFAKPVLCSRCGSLALNFNRSNVFCSFLRVGKKIFYFFLVYIIYIMYICRELKT